MSMENRAIVRRLYEEVWNKRRFELLDELISPSYVLQSAHLGGPAIGPEAYKYYVLAVFKGFPDFRITVEDIFGENEKIVVAWTLSGTHDGEFRGVPATHQKVTCGGITIQHLANGKIIASFVNWDLLGMLKQLGATLSHYRLLEKVGGGGMAFGDGALWVVGTRARQRHGVTSGAALNRIDLHGAVTASIPLRGFAGADVAVARSGVWVATMQGNRRKRGWLALVDPRTNTIRRLIRLRNSYVRRVVAVGGEAHFDRRPCRRMARRILEQVRHDLIDLGVVARHERQIFGDRQVDVSPDC